MTRKKSRIQQQLTVTRHEGYLCDQCDHAASSEQTLEVHMKRTLPSISVRRTEDVSTCSECGKDTNMKFSLMRPSVVVENVKLLLRVACMKLMPPISANTKIVINIIIFKLDQDVRMTDTTG